MSKRQRRAWAVGTIRATVGHATQAPPRENQSVQLVGTSARFARRRPMPVEVADSIGASRRVWAVTDSGRTIRARPATS